MLKILPAVAALAVLMGCGDPGVAVPGVIGEVTEAGIAQLEASGLQVEVLELALDDAQDAEPGSIVSQTPDADVNVEPGSVVVLRVVPGLSQVPDVVGANASVAERELLDLGFEVSLEQTETAARSAGEVHRVDPRAGSMVEPGAMLTLFVAEAPPPPEPSTHTVTVRLEVWRDWSATDGADRCAGSRFLSELRRGQTVSLLGPDGSELSAVLLEDGFVEESVVDDDREVPPQRGVCAWDLSFPDVPEVATYRMDLPHGEVSGSVSLSDARRAGWDLGWWWWS